MNLTTRQLAIAVALAAVLLTAGLGGGFWLARDAANAGHAAPAAATAASNASTGGEREVLYWYDPMVPDQHFDKPGKSPFMDMELVPKYAGDGEAAGTGVRIDPGVQQNLGVRTGVVELGSLASRVSVPGTLAWDLRKEEVVSTPVEAIVSRLDVRAPYERVRAGQPLATVLSPTWGSAIAEARALARADSAQARELASAARERLRVLGLSNATATGNGGVVLRAPREGVVSEILVREGETAMPGTPLFRINGTSTMWLEAAVPQAATQGITPGTRVTATVSAVPGRTFDGEVETLLPQIDPASRTRRARIVLRNEESLLAPGMFAQVSLEPQAGAEVPLIPSEALIATGEDSRVIVVGEDGTFRPVRVTTGRSSGGRTEILSGLEGGERVVTSGQFLIDSEASLSGALGRLEAQPEDPPVDAASPASDPDAPAMDMPRRPARPPGNGNPR